ncbi:hypothetical protein EASAB2608_01028 [Streptomyces sp. EAS-AB2608]|uniref:hypothetical protein n=1 Tax=Streptomyces sp. EAS-AB2608 TaxID=2779671 RepID=UPI001BEEEEBF|nr:hypothetical protein [Streptomyces sp. EAS-AB2608]BCM65694.1 hypothetical protein EASAB2608_01028 [Streptomyces sp. EAS-AB2608]
MTQPVLSLGAGTDPSLLLTLGIPGAATALALTGWALRRAKRSQKRPASGAVVAAALAALGCTAYSADTSWRFAADYLDVAGTAERASMFAAAELGLFATALMARQNLTTQGTPGVPGTLVWVISGVQVIPAYAESGVVGGTVRAFVGPVMAGMLWHLAMGIELRLRTPGAASKGLVASLGREARERLLSRLGIAARDRDAAQITRDRATTRAVDLATRLAELTTEQRHSRRGRRLTRRLSKAIGRASVGTDPAQRAELLAQLAARRNAHTLATVPLSSPWSPDPSGETATVVPAAGPQSSPVPGGGPHTGSSWNGDREPQAHRGPGSETVKQYDGSAPHQAGAGDHVAGNGTVSPQPGKEPDSGSGTDQPGTHPGDQGPGTDQPGTHPGDRHSEHVRRTPASKGKGRAQRSGRSRGPQAQRPTRAPEQDVNQLVELIRPHVPALLDRDGNDTVTRVQLRKILRDQNLPGIRNDRMSLVLAALRSQDSTTTRSTTR